MCLGIPGRVVGFSDESDLLARVDVAGVVRTVNVGLVIDDGVAVGDWVLLHVGFAMSVIDEAEARRAMQGLLLLGEQLDTELDDLSTSRIE